MASLNLEKSGTYLCMNQTSGKENIHEDLSLSVNVSDYFLLLSEKDKAGQDGRRQVPGEGPRLVVASASPRGQRIQLRRLREKQSSKGSHRDRNTYTKSVKENSQTKIVRTSGLPKVFFWKGLVSFFEILISSKDFSILKAR